MFLTLLYVRCASESSAVGQILWQEITGAQQGAARRPGVGNTTGMGELDLQIVDIPGVAKHLVNFVSL